MDGDEDGDNADESVPALALKSTVAGTTPCKDGAAPRSGVGDACNTIGDKGGVGDEVAEAVENTAGNVVAIVVEDGVGEAHIEGVVEVAVEEGAATSRKRRGSDWACSWRRPLQHQECA